MAKKKPRKPYRRPDFRGEAAALNPEKYAEKTPAEIERGRPMPAKGSDEAKHFNDVWSKAKLPEDMVRFTDPPAKTTPPRKPRAPRAPRPTPVDKEPVAPAHPHVVHPAAPQAARGRGRYLVPVAAGAGIIGGAAFLAHRDQRKKAAMIKSLVNPLTGAGVAFEKRYIEDEVDSRPRGALVAKRYDETALDHHGSRRVGGNTPVSTTRVPGLPVASARFSRGNAEARPGTRSHALDRTYIRTKVKHHPRGKLVKIGGNRKTAPGPMAKSLAFSQSAGSGRRLINV